MTDPEEKWIITLRHDSHRGVLFHYPHHLALTNNHYQCCLMKRNCVKASLQKSEWLLFDLTARQKGYVFAVLKGGHESINVPRLYSCM
jgi:hypothetical protein